MTAATDGEGMRVLRNRYTNVPAEAVEDYDNLDCRALGLLVRMLSKPDGWRFNSKRLAKEWPRDGETVIGTGLRMLAEAGYYRVERRRMTNGEIKMGTAVSERPVQSWKDDHAAFKGKPVLLVQQPDKTFKVKRPDGEMVGDGFASPTALDPEFPQVAPDRGFPGPENPEPENPGPGEAGPGESGTSATTEEATTETQEGSSSLRDEEPRPRARAREAPPTPEPVPPGSAGQAPLPGLDGPDDGHRASAQELAAVWWAGLKSRPKSTAARDRVGSVAARALADGWPRARIAQVLGFHATTAAKAPSAPVLDLWLATDKVAATWWEEQDPRPMGRGAWPSLTRSCLAALEQGWTADQVLWVLRERAKSVPKVAMLETWLREAKAQAGHGREHGREHGAAPGTMGGGYRTGRGDRPLTQRQQVERLNAERRPMIAELERLWGEPVDVFALRRRALEQGWEDTTELGVLRAALEQARAEHGTDRPTGRVIRGDVA